MALIHRFWHVASLLVLLGAAPSNCQNTSFHSASSSFSSILGQHPKVSVVAESDRALFHEGGVYYPPTDSLFITSDNLEDNSTDTGLISYISVIGNASASSVTVNTLNNSAHGIPFPLGGYRYLASSKLLAWVGQGSLTKAGGVWFLNPLPPYNATQILGAIGKAEFNSPNDIAVAPSGDIYFSDPVIGNDAGFRPDPKLPNQVYRFNPGTGKVKAVADGFGRSNGVAVSADGSVVYIIDTGAQTGEGVNLQGPRTIYRFDVQRCALGHCRNPGLLGNRELFAFPDIGSYKGVKTDTKGNVYAGADDGVTVWSAGGDLLGKIVIEGGVANLGFGRPGVLFALGDTRLWRIDLAKDVVGSSYVI